MAKIDFAWFDGHEINCLQTRGHNRQVFIVYQVLTETTYYLYVMMMLLFQPAFAVWWGVPTTLLRYV